MKSYNFQVQRYSDDQESTLGLLHEMKVANAHPYFWGYSLEDEFRETKVPGETRIPAGVYEIKIMRGETPLTKHYQKKYPWFKYHLWITGVKGFSGIYIHVGNVDKNTAGCLLIADNANNNQVADGRITESVNCYKRFYEYLYPKLDGGDKAFINVRDEEGVLL